MELKKGIDAKGLGIWLPKSGLLAITDLQLGYEEFLNQKGIFVPRSNFAEIMEKLEKLLQKLNPKILLINGDLKHEFGKVSEQEWRETTKILEFAQKKCEKIILVKGNHDSAIWRIAESKKMNVTESYFSEKEKALFLHGHKKPEKKLLAELNPETIIIGHEHPAITISDGVKNEKYKCFLLGKYEKKILIVMPSFNFVSMGTDVRREKTLSPLIKNIGSFECFVSEGKIYNMGKIKNLP
jgi:uncharacterized protein